MMIVVVVVVVVVVMAADRSMLLDIGNGTCLCAMIV
jgi:hypothetical protein